MISDALLKSDGDFCFRLVDDALKRIDGASAQRFKGQHFFPDRFVALDVQHFQELVERIVKVLRYFLEHFEQHLVLIDCAVFLYRSDQI